MIGLTEREGIGAVVNVIKLFLEEIDNVIRQIKIEKEVSVADEQTKLQVDNVVQ